MPEKFDLFPSLALYERLGVPYVMWSNHGHNNYEGALWTGQVMMLADDTYGDIGHAHELFHWWIAPEEKRPYPDFALGRQVNGGAKFFTASGLPLYDRSKYPKRNGGLYNPGWGEETIPISEAAYQEEFACVAMLCYEAIVNDEWEFPGIEWVDGTTVSHFAVWEGGVHDHSEKIAEMANEMGCIGVTAEIVAQYIKDYEREEFYEGLS